MVTFDDVLPTLVRICEEAPGFLELSRRAVVRDLRGRVRLVVDPDRTKPALDREALANALKAELRGFFVPPIWSTASPKPDEARLAKEIFDPRRAKPWDATYFDVVMTAPAPARSSWLKYERRLSKQEWLEAGEQNAPWELGDGPSIVTFYSFKGGVGRTTALVACAWQLAREGSNVVVVDLDLEAPGVGLMLGANTERGVVDCLVDELAAGNTTLDGAIGPAEALPKEKDRLWVVPAGKLSGTYLEKLARLDFVGGSPEVARNDSPIEMALINLLRKVRGVRFPNGNLADYVLIDARAGLHDLAGLSLHRLAHVDVLLGRTNAQTYPGLELSLRTLVQRKGRDGLACIVVQTMVPPATTVEARFQEAEFRAKSYEWFRAFVYAEDTSIVEADDARHRPSVIRQVEARARYASLEGTEHDMFADDYRELHARIKDACGAKTKESED